MSSLNSPPLSEELHQKILTDWEMTLWPQTYPQCLPTVAYDVWPQISIMGFLESDVTTGLNETTFEHDRQK